MTVSVLLRISAAASLLLLCACVDTSNLSQLADAKPTGTPFQQAQFKAYAYLAHSFGEAPSGDGSVLAEAYAGKALIAASKVNVAPEEPANADQQAVRLRLIRALVDGRSRLPDDAARAQADYDCWILDANTASTAAAARSCGNSLAATLPELEAEIGLSPN
jgi:hypothetical protein